MSKVVVVVLSTIFVFMWSSGWTASHYVVSSSSALSLLSARYIIVLTALVFLVTLFRQWQVLSVQETLTHFIIGALCHAFYLLGSIGAFEFGVSAAAIAFVNSLQPSATASLAGRFAGEYVQPRHFKGLFLGVLSVVLIVSDYYNQTDASLMTLALPFISMLALSVGMVINRRQEKQLESSNEPPRPVILILLVQVIGAVLIIIPISAFNGELDWQFTRAEWGAIVWLALIVSLGSYALFLYLLREISALQVSSLSYMVPPVTLLQSYIMYGEELSFTDVAALLLAIAAVYLILLESKQIPHREQMSTSNILSLEPLLGGSYGRVSRLDIEL